MSPAKQPFDTQTRPFNMLCRCKLGIYDTACDAALAYDRAAIAIKGDLAITNFPPPPDHCREDPASIRRLLESKALTDSEGSDGEGEGGGGGGREGARKRRGRMKEGGVGREEGDRR